jgi:hypothetical protein
MGRLAPAMQASVRRVLRQAWEMDAAEQAEKLIRNLARRLERDAPGVSQTARAADRAEMLPGVYQHYREHDGDGASCQSQREALALGLDGVRLDGCCHAGSQERLSPAETTAKAPRRTRCPPCKSVRSSASAFNSSRFSRRRRRLSEKASKIATMTITSKRCLD